MVSLPELKVTIYSDYICPFCYVGHHRLSRLRDSYDLKINWCFLEIHPEITADSQAIDSLDYSSEQWQTMMTNLKQLASEENIPLSDINFITNSQDALLLSEASKKRGREIFYHLHEQLFTAYFVDGRNIGDRKILKEIALNCGMSSVDIEQSWADERNKRRLLDNFTSAREKKIQSVPSFVFGDTILTGVVSEDRFREEARKLLS